MLKRREKNEIINCQINLIQFDLKNASSKLISFEGCLDISTGKQNNHKGQMNK